VKQPHLAQHLALAFAWRVVDSDNVVVAAWFDRLTMTMRLQYLVILSVSKDGRQTDKPFRRVQ
jgi:hypothetical protein